MKTEFKTLFLVLLLTLSFSGFSYALGDDNSPDDNHIIQSANLNSSYNTTPPDSEYGDVNYSYSMNLESSVGAYSSSSSPSALLPATYDLRTLGRVSPVKNQAPLGTCWDFASLSSLESCLLPNETWDFSENHVKNLLSDLYPEGYDRSYGGGGFSLWVLAYLARWSGPVTESSDPYNSTSGISPEGLTPVKHVQECIFLPVRTGPLDNDILKEAIMKYGDVSSLMFWGDSYYNQEYFSYYTDERIEPWANHQITLVGWDDNFDKNNFKIPAPGNGAFIIKNSWGTNWTRGKSDNGYFYISYYDAYLGNIDYTLPYYYSNIVFNNAEPSTNYKQIYQYDPFGLVKDITSDGSTNAEFMNVFHAETNNPLTAASFYTLAPYTSYQLYTIVNNITTMVAEGVTETAGYKTIKFNQLIPLTAGQEFKIMAKVNTPGYNLPVAIEYVSTWTSKATSNPGESFIKYNGIWTDLTDPIFSLYPEANVCLKAFTAFAGNLTLNIETSNLQPVVGDLLKFTINAANNGPDNSLGTQVNYKLPQGLELTSNQASMGSYNSETGIWNIGELPVGETASLIVYSRVRSLGYIINEATITSLTYNYNPVNTVIVTLNAIKAVINPPIYKSNHLFSNNLQIVEVATVPAEVNSVMTVREGIDIDYSGVSLILVGFLLLCGIFIRRYNI